MHRSPQNSGSYWRRRDFWVVCDSGFEVGCQDLTIGEPECAKRREDNGGTCVAEYKLESSDDYQKTSEGVVYTHLGGSEAPKATKATKARPAKAGKRSYSRRTPKLEADDISER